MKEYTVKLNSIEQVKEFVALTNKCAFDVDLMSGRYAIDAKPLKMIVHADDEQAADFADEAAKFIAD